MLIPDIITMLSSIGSGSLGVGVGGGTSSSS